MQQISNESFNSPVKKVLDGFSSQAKTVLNNKKQQKPTTNDKNKKKQQ